MSPHSTDCPGFNALMEWQADKMRLAIREHKYYESEKAGRDIGQVQAEVSFSCSGHLPCMAHDWRRDFCGGICEHREGCGLGIRFLNG